MAFEATIDENPESWTEPDLGVGRRAGAVRMTFPGPSYRRVSGVDARHGHFVFAWTVVAPTAPRW